METEDQKMIRILEELLAATKRINFLEGLLINIRQTAIDTGWIENLILKVQEALAKLAQEQSKD